MLERYGVGLKIKLAQWQRIEFAVQELENIYQRRYREKLSSRYYGLKISPSWTPRGNIRLPMRDGKGKAFSSLYRRTLDRNVDPNLL